MFGFYIKKGTVLLPLVFIVNSIYISRCYTVDGVVSVHMERTSQNYLQAKIFQTGYTRFQDAFLSNTRNDVILKYAYGYMNIGSDPYISDICTRNNSNNNTLSYFRCSVIQSTQSIQCMRNVSCGNAAENACPDGFGISWSYTGEYLSSKHLQNVTKNCSGENDVTCYMKKAVDTSTTVILSRTTSTGNINTNAMTNSELAIQSKVELTSTTQNTMKNFTSTFFTKSDMTETVSSSDSSTAIKAGVSVGVVIVIIFIVGIVVFVLMKRRNVKNELARNEEIQNSRLELVDNVNSGSIYSKQVQNFDDYNTASTGIEVTNTEQNINYNTNANNHIDPPRKSVTRPIPDLDYAGVEDIECLALPDQLLSSNNDYDCCYSTLDSYRGSLVLRSSNRNDEGINGLVDENYSSVNKVHPVSPQDEYAIVNKNVGYTNLKEMEQNKNRAEVHEYKNIKQDYTSIGRKEPTKNVYSKLRENIRNFEHPYGDEEFYIQTEDNLKVGLDNTYFILEKEEI